jgi:hypothetical protein
MIRFGLVVLLGLSLAGCTTSAGEPSAASSTTPSAPTSNATPTIDATPIPTIPTSDPSPTATEAAVTGVVITSSDVELVSADGATSAEFPYDEDADSLKVALTDAFGSEPESGDQVVYAGTTDYYWEEFSLRVYDDVPYYGVRFYVVTEGASVGGVEVTAGKGIAVGSSESDVAEAAFDHHTDENTPDVIEFYSLDRTEVDVDTSTDDGGPAINFVRVWVPKPGTEISRIDSPVANFGE